MPDIIKILFSYKLLAVICMVLALAVIPFIEGTNTGQDMCVYVDEAEANWSFMGAPCRLTYGAYVTFAAGYFLSFVVLFSFLGGIRFCLGKIFAFTQKCFSETQES